MKKKFWSLLTAAVLTVSSVVGLAGCNWGGNSDKTPDGRIRVTVGMWPEASSPKDVEMWKKWEEQFEADYPEYDIQGTPYPYNKESITSDGPSKLLPTVFQTYFTEPDFLISGNYIADITDELKTLKVSDDPEDTRTWYDCMDPYMRDTVTRNGRVYGVPRDGYGLGLFLNLKMLADVGVVRYDEEAENWDGSKGKYIIYDEENNPLYPTTFDEIREVSQLIVENYNQGTYGMVILSADKNGGWQFSNMAWNFGCENLQIDNGDGTWTANLNDEGAVRALEWIQNMRKDELIYPEASATYTDWFTRIYNETVAMAFCGSDAVMMPVTNSTNFKKEDIAFVPMPSDGVHDAYSLYGGTPFVFSATATSEQIHGALLFLKYIGRSPVVDDISRAAMELGNATAIAKGVPVIPTIKPWTNPEYIALAEELEQKYCNVNMEYFQDFFNSIDRMKKAEEPNSCQDMYALLDTAVSTVIDEKKMNTANPKALLTTANNDFYNRFLKNLK